MVPVVAINLLTNQDNNRSSIELPAGTDFNTIINGGRYNLDANGSLHSPIASNVGMWMFVDIQRHSNSSFTYVTQLSYDFQNAGIIYHRVGTGGDGNGINTTWSTWVSICGLDYTAENTSNKGAYNGYAPLINGKVPQTNLPNSGIAISKVTVAFNESEMVALLAVEGELVIRTDTNQSWVRNRSTRTATISDWVLLSTPTNAVLSVAGKTGTVNLIPSDIGAENISNKGAYNGYAPLINGKVPDINLPVATNHSINKSTVVSGDAAMFALLSIEGDIAIRSDTNTTWIRNASVRTGTISDWTQLSTPTNTVLSVAGKTGAVSLTPTDIGAEPANPNIQSHILNNSNPHNVLTSQISDFSTSSMNGGYF